jgi:predicted aspartyl protease
MVKMARGQTDVAHSMIESVLQGTESPLARIKLLPGAVEMALGASALERASQHSEELSELSGTFGSELFESFALQGRARVLAAEGRYEEAAAIHRKVVEILIPPEQGATSVSLSSATARRISAALSWKPLVKSSSGSGQSPPSSGCNAPHSMATGPKR